MEQHSSLLRRLSPRIFAGVGVITLAYPLWAPTGPVPAVEEPRDNLRYITVAQGDVVRNITAAGTLEAVDTIEVSSQLSGQIASVMADYNSEVRADQPLAALDSTTYESMVHEAEATLAVAQAQLEESRAAVEGARVRHAEALRDVQVKSALAKSGSGAQREAERAQATAEGQAAELLIAGAREQVSSARVAAARASLARVRLDLKRTTIRSPIEGIIIRRSVEIGKTISVSLQPPVLFTIARDLSDMRVNASVSEADIGAVRTGQRAMFSVDSYPGRTFEGRVLEIRKAPQMIQNVVTYTVMISAPNQEGLLFPGMTADTRIAVEEQRDVKVVPNVALIFHPKHDVAVKPAPGKGLIWVRWPSGNFGSMTVSLGTSGDALTGIVSPNVQVGDQVAVGYKTGSQIQQ